MQPRLPGSFLALTLAACTASIHLTSHWSCETWACFEPNTEVRELTVDCSKQATNVRLELRSGATQGDLALTLVDPEGIERHREVVHAGQRDAVLNWPPVRGAWRLRVAMNEFAGSWRAELSASDDPVEIRVDATVDAR
jgi:hypothetical protein